MQRTSLGNAIPTNQFIDQVRRCEGTIEVGDRQAFRVHLKECLQKEFNLAVASSDTLERSPSLSTKIPMPEKQINQGAQASRKDEDKIDDYLNSQSARIVTAGPAMKKDQLEEIVLPETQDTQKAATVAVSGVDQTGEMVPEIQGTRRPTPVPAPETTEAKEVVLPENESTQKPTATLASEKRQTEEIVLPGNRSTEKDQVEETVMSLETQNAQTTILSSTPQIDHRNTPRVETLKRKQSPAVHARTHD